MRSAALWLPVVVGACWTAPPPVEPVSNAAPRVTARRVHDLPQHTVWSGVYYCAQGPTAVTLRLDVDGAGDANAIFEFGPLDENPSVPRGTYRLRGRLLPSDAALRLRLDPDRWIDQPPGYLMVGLDVTVDAPRRALDGRMTDERCGQIAVRRD